MRRPADPAPKAMLRALWEYRALVFSLVRQDFELRSVRALWGRAWLVIQPAAQILIYTVVFAEVLRAKLPGVEDRVAYGLYLCAGILTWNYFSDIVTRGQSLFLEHASLLKTLRFPRVSLPTVLLLGATLDFLIVAVIFLVVLLVLQRWPGSALLAALPLLGLQGMLALALGVVTGTLNVFFRDVGHGMRVVLQFWFWLTPIVYPLAIVPERVRGWFEWNPLYPLVSGYQRIVVHRSPPEWEPVLVLAAGVAVFALLAWGVFRALAPDLVDEL